MHYTHSFTDYSSTHRYKTCSATHTASCPWQKTIGPGMNTPTAHPMSSCETHGEKCSDYYGHCHTLVPVYLPLSWERTIPCQSSRNYNGEIVYNWHNYKQRNCCPAQEPWSSVSEGVGWYFWIKFHHFHRVVNLHQRPHYGQVSVTQSWC